MVDDVARSLGMSKRTLARRLSDEKLWLLGFNEVSAFTHAFKRWTGKTPSQMRIGSAGATQDRWPLPHLRWPAQAVNVEGRVNQNDEEISRKEDEAAQCRQTRH